MNKVPKLIREIKKIKDRLNADANKRGIFEDFGTEDVKKLRAKYTTPATLFNIQETKIINEFEKWTKSYWAVGYKDQYKDQK